MDSETLYLLAKLQAGAVSVLSTTGAPTTGTWFTGNIALDSSGTLFICQVGGTPGTWVPAVTPWLSPVSKSSSYAAANGQFVEATASLTVTSPAAGLGNRFGAIADYAASYSSPVTVSALSGYLIGPGIPASTSSILLGAQDANVAFVSDGTNWIQTQGAQDTGWATLTLVNSWAPPYSDAPAIRLIGNVVKLKGRMVGGANDSLFVNTLPSSVFAAATDTFATANAQISSTDVVAAVVQGGVANFAVQFTGTPQWVSLWGISYTID